MANSQIFGAYLLARADRTDKLEVIAVSDNFIRIQKAAGIHEHHGQKVCTYVSMDEAEKFVKLAFAAGKECGNG